MRVGTHGQLLELVRSGKGAAAAYRILPAETSLKRVSWHPPLVWHASVYTGRDVEVFEFKGLPRDSNDDARLLYSRLRNILTNAAARRSRQVLTSHMRGQTLQTRPLARPTLFLSSSSSTSASSVRTGPLDQIRERWHQDFWKLKDPEAKATWHPPLVW